MEKRTKLGGRRKGSVNHFTRSVREVIAETFDQLQIVPGVNLLDWATENPTEFYKLAAKLIPLQVETETKEPGVLIQIIPDTSCLPLGAIK